MTAAHRAPILGGCGRAGDHGSALRLTFRSELGGKFKTRVAHATLSIAPSRSFSFSTVVTDTAGQRTDFGEVVFLVHLIRTARPR